MLKIFPEQMEAFADAEMRAYEERMAAHLRRVFPEHCRALGAEGLREAIRHGIARARGYGIASEHDLCLYLNLVMILGRDFDQDPRLPWARDVLVDTTLPEPSRRMARLYRRTVKRSQILGEDEHE